MATSLQMPAFYGRQYVVRKFRKSLRGRQGQQNYWITIIPLIIVVIKEVSIIVNADQGSTEFTINTIHRQPVERRTLNDNFKFDSLFRQANITSTPTNAPIVPTPTTSSPTTAPVVPTPTTSSPTTAPIVPTPTTSSPTTAPVVPTPTTATPTSAPVIVTPTTAGPTLIPGTTAAPVTPTTTPTLVPGTTAVPVVVPTPVLNTTNITSAPAIPTSKNVTAPNLLAPVKRPTLSRPITVPTKPQYQPKYCDEIYYYRRQRAMSSKKKKGPRSKGKGVVYDDENDDNYIDCIERDDDQTSGKGMGKMKSSKSGKGMDKMKSSMSGKGMDKMKSSKLGKGKWNSNKGGISDDLFRAPSMEPRSKETSTPTTVPSSNIIEASNGIQTCKTVNGTFGTVSGSSVTPYVAEFSYELETIPGTTSQTIANLVLPLLDQAFGDYTIPFVVDSSVLEPCSTLASLERKWEFIVKTVRGRGQNQTSVQAQQEAEEQWKKLEQEQDQRKSMSSNVVVGFSSAPPDRIDLNSNCTYKSKPENSCFVMLGQMTIYIQNQNNKQRQLQGQQQSNTTEIYQNAIEATMKQFMNNTDNYANISQLIVRLSYVEPKPEPVPEPADSGPSQEKKRTVDNDNDDGINRKIWLGLIGGIGGALLLLVGTGIILGRKNRTSEHISLAQQNAEAFDDEPKAG